MKRHPSKQGSKTAQVFNHQNQRTKIVNLAPPPMRGGYRM